MGHNQKLWTFSIGLLLAIGANTTHASEPAIQEPAFCAPSRFKRFEIKYPKPSAPVRLRVFKLGKVVLAGMAIGDSDTKSVQAVAETYAPQISPYMGHCTWYFGTGNRDAQQAFNHRPLPTPHWALGTDKYFADEFEHRLMSSFIADPTNIPRCAIEESYIGIGCDAQKHRGPSVFAMILSFAGCKPENAAEIANAIWGANGVRNSTRIAIAKRAYDLGAQFPRDRAALRLLFEKQDLDPQ